MTRCDRAGRLAEFQPFPRVVRESIKRAAICSVRAPCR
jgi:hypothetical protein